mmetsp:Transcript_16162/g.14097  ORF Transcript_16162/g.14097 Transcript_16162/m.14097 type:complete len:133 (-) Transcript_16162:763-1161(-)
MLEELTQRYKDNLSDFNIAHAKLRHNKAFMKKLGNLFKGTIGSLTKIQKDIKLNIKQVDISNDLEVHQQSEHDLYDYVEYLKEIMSDLSSISSMHQTLKEFGNSLKHTKKENKKSIKEASKSYTDSKKKADK